VKTPHALALTAFLATSLFVLTVALYLPVSSFEFLNFDDNLYVTENLGVLRGWDAGVIARAFGAQIAGNWQPVTFFSHALDVQMFGLDAGRHHLVSVLIHAGNAVLLFFLVRALGGGLWAGFFLAAIFAWHPLRVESVAWIAERKDVLSTMFLLLAIWTYVGFVRSGKWWLYAMLAVFFCAGLMAKPMLVTLPFALLLLDCWPLKRFAGRSGKSKGEPATMTWPPLLKEKLPLFGISLAFCAITLATQQNASAVRDLTALPLDVRIQTAIVAYAGYLEKFFWPVNLGGYYTHPHAWPWWEVALSGGFLLAVSCTVFRVRHSRPWWIVGWLWYVGTLVPVIGLVQVGNQWMADRYTYIPTIGIAAALVCEAVTWAGASRSRNVMGTLAAVAVLAACLAATSKQIPTWRNSRTVAANAISTGGGSSGMRTNVAISEAQAGRMREALRAFESICRDYPSDPDAFNNLGFALLSDGRPREAIPPLERAIQLKPDYHGARINLGKAYFLCGANDEAIAEFENVIRSDPGDPSAYVYAAMIYASDPKLRDPGKAVQRAETGISLTPRENLSAIEALATAYSSAGRFRESLEVLEKAARLAKSQGKLEWESRLRKKSEAIRSQATPP